MATSEPIRDRRDVKRLSDYYLYLNQTRNHLLVIIAMHTALRISDVLGLTWEMLLDEKGNVCYRLTLVEQKTGKTKTMALHNDIKNALRRYLREIGEGSANGFVFASPRNNGRAITRITAWRVVTFAARSLGLQGCICSHSLRKTFGYHAWKSGVAVPLLMDIYNHSSYEITRRYLGITQEDRDDVYLNLSFA
jgi:integrase